MAPGRMRLVLALMLIVTTALPLSVLAQDQPDPEATIGALQTQVALLEGQAATPTPVVTPVAAQDDAGASEDVAEPAAPRTVNLEILLDDSGSMGQLVDTGETRLEAAKRVLNEVLAAIPTEPGVNVGLRIYGHLGDNSDAGTARQLRGLRAGRAGGWRRPGGHRPERRPARPGRLDPIALSLQRAEADFPDPASAATNAVVLVTDGLETCGGDPAAAAGALASEEKGIVTHVIRFAVTAEEQQILEGITAASGGLLLGAANATELTGALFAILDELDVVKGAGFIGGSALSLLPQGEPGALSVVAVGPYDGNTLPFVVRNNTGETVISLEATGRALNPAGQLIATGGDQLLHPNLLRAGGLSLGYIYFGGAALPPDTTFEIDVEALPVGEDEFENQRDLDVVEAAYVDGRVVGTLRNGYDEPLNGPFGVQVACFDAGGALLDLEQVYTPEQGAAPGEPVTFQAPLFGTFDCPLFLVAGGGFSRSFDRRASEILTPEAAQESPAPAPTAAPAQATAEPTPVPAEEGGAAAVSQGAALATPDAEGCYDLGSAMAVVSGLAAQGLPIGELVEFTAETDPNELLGRPGGYTSKVNFQDTRLEPESTDFDVQDGGAVEVFATPEDLEDRVARLEASWEAFPLLDEDVLFTHESVLLRVSTRLLTADSDTYGAALREIAACP